MPGQERRVWPCDLDQAGVDARPERCDQLRKIWRREHRGGGIRRCHLCPGERQTSHLSGQRVDPGFERTGLLLEGQGPELLPEERPRAVSIAPWVLVTVVVMCSSGSSCSKAACQAFHRCCSANHAFLRFPRVLTFSITNVLTPARESPALLISALRCGSRPSRRPVAVCQRRELPGILVHAGADVPELLLHPKKSYPVYHGSFEAGEAAGHGGRQRDDLVKRRDPRRLCGCRSRGRRALESCAASLPGTSTSKKSNRAWKRFWNELFIRCLLIPMRRATPYDGGAGLQSVSTGLSVECASMASRSESGSKAPALHTRRAHLLAGEGTGEASADALRGIRRVARRLPRVLMWLSRLSSAKGRLVSSRPISRRRPGRIRSREFSTFHPI